MHACRSTLEDPTYLDANPEIAAFVDRPLFHYLRIGQAAELKIRKLGRRCRSPHAGRRIAAQLCVKNEVEIIERTIEHLRAIGVDHIMVCDMSSTDGTGDILREFSGDDFSVLTLTDDTLDDSAPPDRNWADLNFARYSAAPADWVIFVDADEFWIPASGSLKDCAALDTADVLIVDRFNVPLGSEGPLLPTPLGPEQYHELLLIVDRTPQLQKHLQADPNTPWIYADILPKVMAKPTKIAGVAAGLHDVLDSGPPLRRARPNDLLIAHVPLSTPDRFTRKVESIRTLFANKHLDLLTGSETWENNSTAWHWRRWAALAIQGRLSCEFERNVFDEALIGDLRGRGVIRSAADLLSTGTIGRTRI